MQCPYCKEEVIDGALKCMHCCSDLTLLPKAMKTEATDFGVMLNVAFIVWKENLGDLVIMTLVFLLLCWVPIANIGFIAGYTRSLLKVARGQGKSQVGDLFNAWDCFTNLFIYVLINLTIIFSLYLVSLPGALATFALVFILAPGTFRIIDKGRGASDAYRWCFETSQAKFINWLFAYLVGNIIAGIGIVALFIGGHPHRAFGAVVHHPAV
jgi:hypothetical protein